MKIVWTRQALFDLERLHGFLAPVSPRAAAKVYRKLKDATQLFAEHPQAGSPVHGYSNREIRRKVVGRYEIRYEVLQDHIRILNLWHTFEDR